MKTDLAALYRFRFDPNERDSRYEIWRILNRDFFQSIVGVDKSVLDIACGYGEFLNSISAKEKFGVDLNPETACYLKPGVQFLLAPADQVPLPSRSLDVVFVSNFLEHLPTKDACNDVFAEVNRLLKEQGKFVILGPNIRYLADRYWDFYDHHTPLSHLSLEEGLVQAGFDIELVIPRFLPYTSVKSFLPKHPLLVALYLRFPFVWRFLGHQFLVVARSRCFA